ncbi:hypothetical protein ANO11243_075590 [Dothideomycetidae sp. 11243]|nr:hypothetical protein ANO11243_075590 [fungal sp. No.11243]
MLALSADASTVTTIRTVEKIHIWDLKTGNYKSANFERRIYPTTLTMSPDGSVVASSLTDRTLRFWDTEAGATARHKGPDPQAIRADFSANGQRILSQHEDGRLRLWNSSTGEEVQRFVAPILPRHQCQGRQATLCPHGEKIAMTEGSGILVYNANTGLEMLRSDNIGEEIDQLSFSPNGQVIAAVSRSGILILWDMLTDLERRVINHSAKNAGNIRQIIFSPDGSRVALIGPDCATLWLVQSGRQIVQDGPGFPHCTNLAFSPDGTRLAAVLENGSVELLEFPRRDTVVWSALHKWPVLVMAFSSDGGTLATSSLIAGIRLFDVSTGLTIARIDPVYSPKHLQFSRNGRRLRTEFGTYRFKDIASSSSPFSTPEILIDYRARS